MLIKDVVLVFLLAEEIKRYLPSQVLAVQGSIIYDITLGCNNVIFT